MNITVQIFGLEFTNISDTPQPWWVETDYLPKAINCFQKAGLWQNFRYCYNLLADRMHQFDSLEALLELSKSWESKGIYILRHSEASRDYTLHWLLNREGVDSLSPNSLGLSLDIEDTYLQQVQNIEIEQLINFVSELHSAFKDVMLFGSAVNIRIEGITYPRVLPPRLLNHYFAPCLVNFFSRKFLAQFNKWDAEKKEKLLSLPLPPKCKRIERGDLVILQWVDNLHDVEHISQRLGLQDEWFVGAVNPELDLSYNELGDKRATIPPLSPDNFVTFYSHWGEFGFEAVVPEENYQIEPETLARLQQWLAAGQLPDGKTLTSISLIVPSRTAAIRVRKQAKAAGMGPIYYVDNDGNLWRPYPYASLTESPDSQAATSIESSCWFNPDQPAASSFDADINDIDEEQREARWEAEKRSFVQEIFDYFQQEQPEWKVDLAPPEDAKKEIFEYLKIGKWSDGEERLCEMNIHASFCQFLFYSFCPIGIPESKVLGVTELVTRINYGIKFGHLEFVYVMDGDYRSWETRYKTGIEYVDFPLCRAVIRNIVNNSVSGLDKHVQAIRAVLKEDVSPAVAAATLVMPTEEMEQNVPSGDELFICSQCLQQMQEEFCDIASLLLLKSWEWKQIESPTQAMAEVNYSGENGTFKSEFIVRRQGQEFLSYSIYPMAVPPSKRLAVAELIVQFDSQTSYNTYGNYELNWDSGQLRYKTSIDFKGGEFNRILAARAAYYCVASMDNNLPLFGLVIEEDVPPNEALAQFYDCSDEDEEFDEDDDDFEEQESFDDN